MPEWCNSLIDNALTALFMFVLEGKWVFDFGFIRFYSGKNGQFE